LGLSAPQKPKITQDFFVTGSLIFEKRQQTVSEFMKKSISANTIVPATPVWAIGTFGNDNKPNVMTAAWAGVCCSKPPCICVSLRKATSTHGNIMKRKAFTVSIPSEKYVKEADFFGMNSARDVDKFSATGLTAEKSDVVDAPYVKEFPLILECKVIQIVEIGLHTEFIGEVIDVKADSLAKRKRTARHRKN